MSGADAPPSTSTASTRSSMHISSRSATGSRSRRHRAAGQPAGRGVDRAARSDDAPRCADVNDALLQRLAEQVARISNQGSAASVRCSRRCFPMVRASSSWRRRRHARTGRSRSAGIVCSTSRSKLMATALCNRCAKPSSSSPEQDPIGFLREAVADRKTILISGGTSTGKTTFLNALLREVPVDERVIVVEDTAEVQLHGQRSRPDRRQRRAWRSADQHRRFAPGGAAPSARPYFARRAARQGGGQLPARGQHRPSRDRSARSTPIRPAARWSSSR